MIFQPAKAIIVIRGATRSLPNSCRGKVRHSAERSLQYGARETVSEGEKGFQRIVKDYSAFMSQNGDAAFHHRTNQYRSLFLSNCTLKVERPLCEQKQQQKCRSEPQEKCQQVKTRIVKYLKHTFYDLGPP